MLERFVDISVPVRKALDDPTINKRSLFPDENEMAKIKALLTPLIVVRDVTVRLQGNDVNLAKADEVRNIFSCNQSSGSKHCFDQI